MDDKQDKSANRPSATTFHVEQSASTGRARRKLAYEEVVKAAEALVAEGVEPSVAKVRRETGGGTDAISAFLARWREARRAGARAAAGDGLSDELRMALMREMAATREAAGAEVQEQLVEATEALEEVSAELAQERAAAEAHEATIEGLRRELEAARKQAEDAAREADAAHKALGGELQGLKEQLAQLHAKHNEAHVAAAEARVRAECAAKEATALKADNEQLRQKLVEAQDKVSAGAAAVAEERHKAAVALEKVAGHTQLAVIADKAVKEARERAAEHAQRARQVDEACERLRHELDVARKEAAAAAAPKPVNESKSTKASQGGKTP